MSVCVCLELIHLDETGSQLRDRSWRMTAVIALRSGDIMCVSILLYSDSRLCRRQSRTAFSVWTLKTLKMPHCPVVRNSESTCSKASPVSPFRKWRPVLSIGGMTVTGDTGVLGGKPCPVPLCPPQISRGLAWDRTRTFAVRGTPVRTAQ